jgi:predicted deacylase
MDKEPFVILGQAVALGKSLVIEMEVAKLHTRNSITIPVIIERGKKPGPTVLLMAGVHGDEINGVAIIRKIIREKHNKPLIGTIVCIPVLNVFGYLNQDRFLPDGRDLNRSFPGAATGSLASQFAFKFMKEIAPLVDYVLDFHTGGNERANHPQIRIAPKQEHLMELAKIFAPPFIVESPCVLKSIRDSLTKLGVNVLLFEGGKSKKIHPKVMTMGVNGTLRVLHSLGMIENKIAPLEETVLLKESKWIRAPHSGMLYLNIRNGIFVQKKDVLGFITDPYGDFERKVLAPFDGYIFGINNAPIVNKGDAIFHIGLA